MANNCTNSTGLIDNNSLGVLTTLGFDILVAVILGVVWLILRKYRGDKKTVDTEVQRQTSGANNELFLTNSEVEAPNASTDRFTALFGPTKIPGEEQPEAPSASTDRISALFGKLVKRKKPAKKKASEA